MLLIFTEGISEKIRVFHIFLCMCYKKKKDRKKLSQKKLEACGMCELADKIRNILRLWKIQIVNNVMT